MELTPWERVKLARMPIRPTGLDFIGKIFEEFIELHGDRYFRDDQAIVGGIAYFERKQETDRTLASNGTLASDRTLAADRTLASNGSLASDRLLVSDRIPVTVIAQQKGRSTKENIARNFSMPHPEGYRKALRLMKQAEKFHRPIICFIDTPGAYCGIGAEERGQGEAIASNLAEMMLLKTPIISIVISEGGSGGALALGVADRIYMLENAIYSILSPEGFASILYKDSSKAEQAAYDMKLTAKDLFEFGVIDGIITEPQGGAHNDYDLIAGNVKAVIEKELKILLEMPMEQLLEERYQRFRRIGS